MKSTQVMDLELPGTVAIESMATVRRFFHRAPQFTQFSRAIADFAREDFHQPLEPGNFLSFIEREAGDLDEESILEYCRMHLDFAGLWNLGLELEVRGCWRLACMLEPSRDLAQGNRQPAVAA